MTSNPEGTLTVRYEDLPAIAGRTFGPSAWRTVTQEEVAAFAELTGDHNPIHVDPEFAKGTPFGATIAHGYFTLSLVVPLEAEVVKVTGFGVGINYGLDRLRFPAPVTVGSRIRVVGEITAVEEVAGGYQVAQRVTFEIEGGSKPACVADTVVRYYA